MKNELRIEVEYLPISVNKYLAPRIQTVGRKKIPVMYETKLSKDWKTMFRLDTLRAIRKQKFDREETKDGYWYLDCGFVLKRKNQDCNNFFKIMIDALISVAIIDDKNIMPRVQWLNKDTKHPKTVVRLHKAGEFDYKL
ncbi:MAG: hypothetical protein ABF991_00265 [Liquorilactobacillus hordei]|uniref:hypothetical protein n=1 Tax=Liquorilactobacillus hordei TaxID=468911 RepID=UPI0039E77DAA